VVQRLYNVLLIFTVSLSHTHIHVGCFFCAISNLVTTSNGLLGQGRFRTEHLPLSFHLIDICIYVYIYICICIYKYKKKKKEQIHLRSSQSTLYVCMNRRSLLSSFSFAIALNKQTSGCCRRRFVECY
jgi:hypothetical protein